MSSILKVSGLAHEAVIPLFVDRSCLKCELDED